jgi:3-oxoacyl-[acyl-carrier protein] reductase
MNRRRTVVTGAYGGIGRAIVAALAADSDVIAIGRDKDKLARLSDDLPIDWIVADVSDADQVDNAARALAQRYGAIDVLVNNAGVFDTIEPGPLDAAERVWDRVLDANLKGTFLMSHAMSEYLTRPGGRIVNISSVAAYSGGLTGAAAAYSASKAGLIGLTRSMARGLGPSGITVNVVVPGYIANTGMTDRWPTEQGHAVCEQTLLKRPGRADEVAAAVHFLASDRAAFITGAALPINGGWHFAA